MSLALMLPGARREVVKTTPVMTLGAVLAEACGRPPRPLGDPAQFMLMNGKAVLDLSTPVRFAGLASGARLDVVRNPAAAASAATPQPQPAAVEAQQPAGASARQAEAAQPDAEPAAAGGDTAAEGTCAACGDGGAAGGAAGSDADPALMAAAAASAAAAGAAAAEASAAVAARLGRAVRVYSREALLRAAHAAPVEELPESFYEFTPEDFQTVAAAAKRKEEPVMMTKAMRDAAVAKRAAEYSRTLVRVELPGGALVLEAAFAPLEPLSALRDLVAACLDADAAAASYLFTAPPKKRMESWGDSFYAAKLIPAARVHCALEGARAKDWPADKPLLRADVAALRDAVPPSAAPLADRGGAQPAPSAATVAPRLPSVSFAEPQEPPREGVRPPGELRAKLAEGGKPKWLKL